MRSGGAVRYVCASYIASTMDVGFPVVSSIFIPPLRFSEGVLIRVKPLQW